MGYGLRANSLLGFSWQHRISDFDSMSLGITSQRYGSNSHRNPPTRLPRDYHRPGSLIFLRPPSTIRQPLGKFAHHKVNSPNVATLGLGAGTEVLEYQPVVHRLRLSASP